MRYLGKKNKDILIWVPGHSGIRGNEEANTLAKEGARISLIGPESFCGIDKCTYKKEFLEKEKAEKKTGGISQGWMDHSTKFLQNFEATRHKRYLDLGKKQLHLLPGFFRDTFASSKFDFTMISFVPQKSERKKGDMAPEKKTPCRF